jgi:predicted Zn-dependent protease
MHRILVQGLILLAAFFGLFFGLKQLNWVGWFGAQTWSDTLEKELGEIFWEAYSLEQEEITQPEANAMFSQWVQDLCEANGLKHDDFKLHLLRQDEVNAFALPDGHLVIYSGLVQKAESAEAFLGVVCHEIAHIQLAHVKQKLIKEVGLSVLLSMVTGNGQPQAVQAAVEILSSTAFDRELEREADQQAVEYLLAAGLNPLPFADFMEGLAEESSGVEEYFSWMSTHPSSKERASDIRMKAAGREKEVRMMLPKEDWERFQERVNDGQNRVFIRLMHFPAPKTN